MPEAHAAAHAEPDPKSADRPAPALRCPRCDYDLAGPVPTWTESCPVTGVCPECGLGFRYGEVFEPLRDVPEWFFELARKRRVRALISTAVRSLRPARFWRDVKLSFPWRPRRLLVFALAVVLGTYLFVLVGVFLLTGFAHGGLYAGGVWNPTQRQWTGESFAPGMILPTLRDAAAWPGFPPVGGSEGGYFEPTWYVVLFVGATSAGFLFLPTSLRRAKVRAAHVWRAVVYASAPVAVCYGAYVAVIIGAVWFLIASPRSPSLNPPYLLRAAFWIVTNEFLLIAPIVPLTFWIWLNICRRYFRIDHALGVAFAVTLIGTLVTLLPLLLFSWALTDLVLWLIG